MCDFEIINVPGELNPSDYFTKKTNADKYLDNIFWQQGPKFSEEDNENIFKKYQSIKVFSQLHTGEAKKELKPKANIDNQVVKSDKFALLNLIYKWSNFNKFFWITSFCLKASAIMTLEIRNLKRKSEIQTRLILTAFIDKIDENWFKKVVAPKQVYAPTKSNFDDSYKFFFEQCLFETNRI